MSGGFIRSIEEKGLTGHYVGAHRQHMRRLIKFAEAREITCVSKLDTKLCLEYLRGYEAYSAAYQLTAWVILRKFLTYAENPALSQVHGKIVGLERTNVRWLNREQCRIVAEMALKMAPKHQLAVFGGLAQGLRKIEIRRMTSEDAREGLRTGQIRIRGKGGKQRLIPVQEEFRRVLEEYIRRMPAEIDLRGRISPISESTAQEVIRQVSVRSGIEFSSHDLRRSFAHNLFAQKEPIEVIGHLLGHSSIDMTRRYLGIGQPEMTAALKKYRLLDYPMATADPLEPTPVGASGVL